MLLLTRQFQPSVTQNESHLFTVPYNILRETFGKTTLTKMSIRRLTVTKETILFL